jgi:SpoVK/Ycf46/Vps4 family AAA+-type ATPase
MKSVKFYKDNDTVRVLSIDTETLVDKLEPAIYTLNKDIFGGYFLTFKSKTFDVPEKIYGSTKARAEKVINTYTSREKSTGIMLTGDKGSGKTMLSSVIGNEMLGKGLPVILIESPHHGPGFNEIINNIGEAVLFFDEFGKIFKEDNQTKQNPQDHLLSIFDGTGSQKRLVILTENKDILINEYMKNRPGRIFYHFKYKKIEEQVIREYAADFNIKSEVIEDIVLKAERSYEFSFDVLKAVVEEHLRYNEDIDTICKDLNIESSRNEESYLKIATIYDAKEEKELQLDLTSKTIRNPVGSRQEYVHWITGKDKDGENEYGSVNISIKDIVKKVGTKTIFKKDNIVIVTEEDKPVSYGMGWMNAL